MLQLYCYNDKLSSDITSRIYSVYQVRGYINLDTQLTFASDKINPICRMWKSLDQYL